MNSCLGDAQIPCYLGALVLTYMEMKEVFLKVNHQEKKVFKSTNSHSIILGPLTSKSQSCVSKI